MKIESSLVNSRYKTSYLENESTIHKKIPAVAQSRVTERPCKEVCMLILRLYISNDQLPPENTFPQKMMSHVDVLGVRRTHCVSGMYLAPSLSSNTVKHVKPKPGETSSTSTG